MPRSALKARGRIDAADATGILGGPREILRSAHGDLAQKKAAPSGVALTHARRHRHHTGAALRQHGPPNHTMIFAAYIAVTRVWKSAVDNAVPAAGGAICAIAVIRLLTVVSDFHAVFAAVCQAPFWISIHESLKLCAPLVSS